MIKTMRPLGSLIDQGHETIPFFRPETPFFFFLYLLFVFVLISLQNESVNKNIKKKLGSKYIVELISVIVVNQYSTVMFKFVTTAGF